MKKIERKPDKFFIGILKDTSTTLDRLNDSIALNKSNKIDSDFKPVLFDGSIKRFENLFTKIINLVRFALSKEGVETLSPNQVITEATRLKWIKDTEYWIIAMDARSSTINKTSDLSNSEYMHIISQFSAESEVIIGVLTEIYGEK